MGGEHGLRMAPRLGIVADMAELRTQRSYGNLPQASREVTHATTGPVQVYTLREQDQTAPLLRSTELMALLRPMTRSGASSRRPFSASMFLILTILVMQINAGTSRCRISRQWRTQGRTCSRKAM